MLLKVARRVGGSGSVVGDLVLGGVDVTVVVAVAVAAVVAVVVVVDLLAADRRMETDIAALRSL